jgi:hypothetical protein
MFKIKGTRTLGQFMIASIIIILILFSIFVEGTGYSLFTKYYSSEYSDSAYKVGLTAKALIKENHLVRYLENKGEDEEYKLTYERLGILTNNMDVSVIYVVKPDSDYKHYTNVFNVVNKNSGYDPWKIGSRKKTSNKDYEIEYKKIDDIYIGEFLNDEITGFGFYTWANKHTYEGDFINGKMDGKGIYKWPEGGEYNGDYVNNIKEGYGVFKWADGKIFTGPFGNGKPNGKGKLTIDNITINCEFKDGKFKGNLKEILKFKKMESKENEKKKSIYSI